MDENPKQEMAIKMVESNTTIPAHKRRDCLVSLEENCQCDSSPQCDDFDADKCC